MHALQKFIVRNQQLCISSDRSIFWEDEKCLIVSDLHFGKTGHFRKEGIAVPQFVFRQDLQRLVSQIQFFKPDRLIVVGDMFHSNANKELDLFSRWRNDFENLHIDLVRGNHDILQKKWYVEQNIVVHEDSLTISPFCFQHDPGTCSSGSSSSSSTTTPAYVFSGHIHPGVTFNGMGKQSLRFPCFYFTESYCVLPAFSHFTGFVSVHQSPHEVVFAIINNSLVRVGQEKLKAGI
jgi:uncharacterized protein